MPNGLAGSAQVSYPLVAPSGTAGAPSFSFAASPTSGMYLASAGIVGFSGAATFGAAVTVTGVLTVGATKTLTKSGTDLVVSDSVDLYAYLSAYGLHDTNASAAIGDSGGGLPGLVLGPSNTISWRSGSALAGTTVLSLYLDLSDVLAQKRGTNAQEFRVYGTTTGSKYIALAHDGASGFVGTTSGGVYFTPASGIVGPGTPGAIDLGATGSRWRSLYLGGNTPAASSPMIDASQTWNDAGVTFIGAKFIFTDTNSAAGSLAIQVRGGAAGATDLFYVDKAGAAYCGSTFTSGGWVVASGAVQCGSTAYFAVNGRLFFSASADGVALLQDNAQTSFGRLCFGGTTAAFPAIARDGANLALVPADGSAGYIDLTVHDLISSSVYLSNIVAVGANNTNFVLGGSGITAGLVDSAASFIIQVTGGAVLATFAGTGYLEMTEVTAPSAPAANSGRIYFEDNGAGKTRLMCLFASGSAQQLAIEP